MKKTLLPIVSLALAAVVSSCGPAAKGKEVAQKYCECSEYADLNKKNDCFKEFQNLRNKYRRDYLDDNAALKEFEEAFNSNLSCVE